MTRYVLDTSVAVAWYLPEDFTSAARSWQRELMAGRVSLVVPTLHFWELANVLRTYVRRGELEPDLARDVYELHLAAPLDIGEPRADDVLDVAVRYESTAYDAVYIALALERDLRLLTAERSTRPWVVKLGDRVERVRPERG